jgi:chorismate mutase
LNWLRAEIDELDDKLWDTIAARMDVSRRIGEWKKANGVAPLQPERYEMIRERLKNLTPTLSSGEGELRTEFKLALWELIHEESLRQQE